MGVLVRVSGEAVHLRWGSQPPLGCTTMLSNGCGCFPMAVNSWAKAVCGMELVQALMMGPWIHVKLLQSLWVKPTLGQWLTWIANVFPCWVRMSDMVGARGCRVTQGVVSQPYQVDLASLPRPLAPLWIWWILTKVSYIQIFSKYKWS